MPIDIPIAYVDIAVNHWDRMFLFLEYVYFYAHVMNAVYNKK